MLKKLSICILVFYLLQGCDTGKIIVGDGEVRGSTVTATQVFDTHEFDGVLIDRAFNVTVAEGNNPRVILTADDNLLSLFNPKIVDGILMLDFSKGFKTNSEIKMLIESPNIERINHQGTGTVLLDNLKLKFLEISSTGSGKITGMGTVQKLWIEATGSGKIMLQDMESQKCDILMTGSGEIEVTVAKELNAVNKGKGDIFYHGSPDAQTLDNTGPGNIKRK